MVGRSIFFETAKAITGGNDKLVTAVDYVKGGLVHDNGETVQSAIDRHLSSNPKVHKDMTKKLQKLLNFLKNLYKEHIVEDEECVEWPSHGIRHGLGVPESVSKPRHYSMMETNELDALLDERGIDRSDMKTKKARIDGLMKDDHEKENDPAALLARLGNMKKSEIRAHVKRCRVQVGNKKNPSNMKNALAKHLSSLAESSAATVAESSEASTNATISESSASTDSSDGNATILADLNDMSLNQLRKLVKEYNLVNEHNKPITSRSPEPLRVALREHLSSLDANGRSSFGSSDSGSVSVATVSEEQEQGVGSDNSKESLPDLQPQWPSTNESSASSEDEGAMKEGHESNDNHKSGAGGSNRGGVKVVTVTDDDDDDDDDDDPNDDDPNNLPGLLDRHAQKPSTGENDARSKDDEDEIEVVDKNQGDDLDSDLSGSDDESTKTKESWCDGCAFLHYFMLEELPNAFRNVKRTEENAKSLDNVFEYLEDSHEKFVLYQAHVVRVVNQNRKLREYERNLYDLCCKEKNDAPLHLWLVIDFKMKWEAMYGREKTTENFAKRGISWHGNRVHAFVWDKEKEKPVKVVIKLDQILEGWNKQDGMTVLALVEAALVFLKMEFPNAAIDFLQSDNAAAYHLKELVLGIPLLNAVSMGPW